jgi:hypothetical protein
MIDDNPYGWRAGVRDNPVMRSLDVTIGEVHPEHVMYVTHIGTDGIDREQIARNAYSEMALNMPLDMARALHDALAEYFGTTSSVLGLRSDYVHERGRVDRLIDTVSKIATGEPR